MSSGILHFTWAPPPCCFRLTINIHNPSLLDTILVAAWLHWLCTLPHCSAFASDVSKDNLKTLLAATDIHTNTLMESLVPHSNAVFTMEAFAFHLSLTSLLVTHLHILILTDSLSVFWAATVYLQLFLFSQLNSLL